MSLATALALVRIAKNQGTDQPYNTSDLSRDMGLSSSTTSRLVYHLADGIQGSQIPSLNCIEVSIDPT